jgi:4-alpha-glucanotransferase
MAADGFAWWKRRFAQMGNYFDAFRIDHILGFFRIWEIPGYYAEGLLGHFNPARPLSPAEIRAFGFAYDPARFTVPRATETSLAQWFDLHRPKIADLLAGPDTDGFFQLRPGFERAETRQAWYAAHCSPAEADVIEQGMQPFAFEVLFLEDLDQPGHYHPRVGLENTRLFASLADADRAALARLHEDFFYRRHNHFWEAEAQSKLPALRDASRMLICGEDLGMIPDCVPGVLKRLGILSLEVQRMPKGFGQSFGLPSTYPYLSVSTTSTHDMSTLRGWWEEDAEGRERFYREIMDEPGDPPDACTPDICEFVVKQHLAGASMWCILPLQDWLALDPELQHPVAAEERINVPADPRHYWRYRLHLTIEQLLKARRFNRRLAGMIRQAGRNPGV